MTKKSVITSDSPEQLLSRAAADFATLHAATLEAKGHMRVVLTGGTLGIAFIKAMEDLKLNLSGVSFMFGDERFVGFSDPDRNEFQGLSQLDDESALKLRRYPSIEQPIEAARAQLDQELTEMFGDNPGSKEVFDLVILGVGPDGHVASLFPGHDQPGLWVVAEAQSPKPPSHRLSLSYRALNSAGNVWFLVSGSPKAPVVSQALSDENCRLPLAQVTGRSETRWYLDKELSDAL